MTTMIQIRNVSDTLHRRLKARAAMEGISMSQFVIREIERSLERPSRKEVLEAIRNQPKVTLGKGPAAVLREERDSRCWFETRPQRSNCSSTRSRGERSRSG